MAQDILHRLGFAAPNSFRGQVSLTLVTSLTSYLATTIVGLIVARLLGPQGRGEFAAIQSWTIIVASFAAVGMPEAVLYYVSQSPGQSGRYLASAWFVVLACGIPIVATGWLMIPRLLHAQSHDVIVAAQWYVVIWTLTYVLASPPFEMLRSFDAWRAWNGLRLLPNVGWLAVVSVWAFVRPLSLNAIGLSRVHLAIGALNALVSVLIVLPRVRPPYTVDTSLFRPMLEFGLPVMLNVLPRAMNLRLDQMLMAAFFEPRLLGLYVVAVAWGGIGTPVFNAIGPVLFPRLSAIVDRIRQHEFLVRIARLNAIANLGITALLAIGTSWGLPWLFGSAYRASVPAALILVFANGISGFNSTLSDGLRGMGRPRDVLTAELLGLSVTAVLLILLLPSLSIIGAAIASLGAYATVCGYLIMSVIRTRASTPPRAVTRLQNG